MLLMVVASYSRLLSIESSEESVRTDALPGVYYSTMLRGAWVDSYVLTQQLLGFHADGTISAADQLQFKELEDRLVEQIANYQTTVFRPEDAAAFDLFKRDHEAYNKLLVNVLDLYQHRQSDQAIRLFNEQLTPAWAPVASDSATSSARTGMRPARRPTRFPPLCPRRKSAWGFRC